MAAALLCLALAAPSPAGEKSWNTGNGSWGDPAHWTPFGVPAGDDDIRIGNMPGVQNSTVMLTPNGSGYDLLAITSGMTLDMNGGELVSFDLALITGDNSRLIARPAPGGINEHAFNGRLQLGSGAHFELRDNVAVRIHGDSDSFGTISGRGTFLIASVIPFSNAGVIRPSANGGLLVQQGTFGDQVIDLDGQGTGDLALDTPFAELEVVASMLFDDFSGSIWMDRGALLTMSIADGWAADSQSLIYVLGDGNPAAASQIAGAACDLDGEIIVAGAQGHLRFVAPVILHENAVVVVGNGDWLEFDGGTTVDGGQYTVLLNAQLDFDGQTTVKSGEFDTFGTDPADGSVNFNGATTWNGGCNVTGVARQMGNAFVSGATVINAEVLDMDGDGDTLWTVWNDLVINADSVQSDNAADFHGTITVASTTGRLMMNLPAADPLFSMAGEMNLIGHPAVFHTRYAGTALDLIGDLNVSGKVAIDAYLHAFDGTVDIADANAVLRLDDGGLIASACTFSGDGELWIGPTSDLQFTNVDLNTVGLVNQGTLSFEPTVSVDRFVQEAGGTWEVSLRGYQAGVDHDQLLVTGGTASLDGAIEVELQDVGGTPFAPEVGDEFTILTASGGVTGTFGAVLTHCSNGALYHWTVLYGGHDARLRLDGITGLSGDPNCDCSINGLDIQPFLLALIDPQGYVSQFPDCDIDNADVNQDGVVDTFDVEPFLELLLAG